MTTKPLLAALPLAALLVLAACVPAPQQTPAPAPAPAPTPAPAPPPVPAPAPPLSGMWMDAPITPGDWSYAGGVARFGEPTSEPRLTLRCDRAAGVIEISRPGSAAPGAPMIVRAETAERSIAATTVAGALPSTVARIPAHDPLLDAMAFSKGRFAIETSGLPSLYVPSWQEVTRVIEDCR